MHHKGEKDCARMNRVETDRKRNERLRLLTGREGKRTLEKRERERERDFRENQCIGTIYNHERKKHVGD